MSQETAVPATIDLSKYIDTKYFGERPHIRGRRIPVAAVANGAQMQQWSIYQIMDEFDLSEAEVLAALLYYQEYQTVIDQQEAIYQTELNEMYRLYGKD
ncbi:MAG: DUF433 domain-containing protein [bacterium]|nr:DUF433 domain-containing protein [bacterium]